MSFFNKLINKPKLGEYQKRKLLFDFQTFFDVKRVGLLQWKDFEALQEQILEISGWKAEDEWWLACLEMFKEIWGLLLSKSTTKNAQQVTTEEWLELWVAVLKEKQDFEKKKLEQEKKKPVEKKKTEKAEKTKPEKSKPEKNEAKPEVVTNGENSENTNGEKPAENGEKAESVNGEKPGVTNGEKMETASKGDAASVSGEAAPGVIAADMDVVDSGEVVEEVKYPEYFPGWLQKYLHFKFKFLDRAGDGKIDSEEFEYVLWDGLGIGPQDCREAFKVLSQEGQKTLTEAYYTELLQEFYFSDEPKGPGNYVNGRLIE